MVKRHMVGNFNVIIKKLILFLVSLTLFFLVFNSLKKKNNKLCCNYIEASINSKITSIEIGNAGFYFTVENDENEYMFLLTDVEMEGGKRMKVLNSINNGDRIIKDSFSSEFVVHQVTGDIINLSFNNTCCR